MFRTLIIGAILLTTGFAETELSVAEDVAPVVNTISYSTIEVSADSPGAPAPSAKGSSADPKRATARPTWSFWIYSNVDGQFCRQRRTTHVEAVAEQLRPFTTYSMDLPVCAKPSPGESPPPADEAARSFWDVRVLPSPVLKVVPDYAITGKLVYLQIAGESEQRFDVDNPLGDDVAIHATSTYRVDWGDGTTTTTRSQGGPWPSGDVTHVYERTSPGVAITVTQLWSATWTAGPSTGDLADLQTTGALTMPVTQLQAVRNI